MRRTVNGILLLDKPANISSNGALQRVKYLFNAKKAGHTGSLDPLATGMLPICFGEATKFSQYLLDSDKIYEVTAQLGVKTSTGDAEGEIIEQCSVDELNVEKIETVLNAFLGEIQQIPPMYSALKHKGKPLYKLARKGIEIDRAPRKIMIHDLDLQKINGSQIYLKVHCSKGTYIRTLIEDIATKLDTFAYVAELRRTAISHYMGSMYTLSELINLAEKQGIESLDTCLQSVDTAVATFPALKLSSSSAYYIKMGQSIRSSLAINSPYLRLFAEDGRFLGIGEVMPDGRIKPSRMVSSQVEL